MATDGVIRFFHDRIPNPVHKALYCHIEKAMLAGEKSVTVPFQPWMNSDDLGDQVISVIECVYNDHPMLFFINIGGNFSMRSVGLLTKSLVISWSFKYSDSETVRYRSELEQKKKEIMEHLFPKGVVNYSELMRERLIYDWMAKHITYDFNAAASDVAWQSQGAVAWNAYGALVKEHAVCYGIACAFKMLCDAAGLPTIVVVGNAGQDDAGHAWNIIKLGKRFYNVDVTWCLRHGIESSSPYAYYQYFNVPDLVFQNDHTPKVNYLPKCVSLHDNPYKLKGLYADNEAEFVDIVVRQFKLKTKKFAILCPKLSLNEERLKNLIADACNRCPASYVYLSDQYRCYVGFNKQLT